MLIEFLDNCLPFAIFTYNLVKNLNCQEDLCVRVGRYVLYDG